MIVCLSAGRDAPRAVREAIAPGQEQTEDLLAARHPGIAELVILSTCHRVEFYAAADGDEHDAIHHLRGLLPEMPEEWQAEVTVLRGAEAVEHLFRVAAGLDSLAVGERQILGQVRTALHQAREFDGAGPLLTTIFSHALHLGKVVRAQTAIGDLGASIGSATASVITQRLGDLTGVRGTIVGAGQAAEDAAAALSAAELTIVSRDLEHARSLAFRCGVSARPWDERVDAMRNARFIVVAVSGRMIVTSAMFLEGGPSLIVDLSVPAAVDPVLRPLTLEELPVPSGPSVEDAIRDAEILVSDEVRSLERWYDTREDAGREARRVRRDGDRILRDELAVAGLTIRDAHTAEPRVRRELNRLLHEPLVRARTGERQELDHARIRGALRSVITASMEEL